MTAKHKAIVAAMLTLFFLYKMITDTAAGHGLVPLGSADGAGWIDNATYIFPLVLSLLWLLKSVRDIALTKND